MSSVNDSGSERGLPGKGNGNGLIQSLLSGDGKGVGGALCNDQNGMCLGSRGDIDDSRSGVYTSLVKLASQLDSGNEPPLITIEYEKAVLLVKDYDEHAVALRVPVTEGANGTGNTLPSPSASL
jgi:hepatitis B virus X-interacting protein